MCGPCLVQSPQECLEMFAKKTYCTVLYCTVLYCTVLFFLCNMLRSTTSHMFYLSLFSHVATDKTTEFSGTIRWRNGQSNKIVDV